MQTLRNRAIHDGHLAIRLCPPLKRVDWINACRERTISLFGKRTWVELLQSRLVATVKRYRDE